MLIRETSVYRTENLYFGTLCKCHPDRRTNCFLSLESSLCPFMSNTHQISTRFLHNNLRTPLLRSLPNSILRLQLGSLAPRVLHLIPGTASQALETTPTQPPLGPFCSPFLDAPIHFLPEPPRRINPHGLTPIPASELSLRLFP